MNAMRCPWISLITMKLAHWEASTRPPVLVLLTGEGGRTTPAGVIGEVLEERLNSIRKGIGQSDGRGRMRDAWKRHDLLGQLLQGRVRRGGDANEQILATGRGVNFDHLGQLGQTPSDCAALALLDFQPDKCLNRYTHLGEIGIRPQPG